MRIIHHQWYMKLNSELEDHKTDIFSQQQRVTCKEAAVLCSKSDDTILGTNSLPPCVTLKLTGTWGESKNDFKGEDEGLK